MHGCGRINEVAAQRAQPRENSLLILAGEPAKADHVGGEDRGELAAFAHLALRPAAKLAQWPGRRRRFSIRTRSDEQQ